MSETVIYKQSIRTKNDVSNFDDNQLAEYGDKSVETREGPLEPHDVVEAAMDTDDSAPRKMGECIVED